MHASRLLRVIAAVTLAVSLPAGSADDSRARAERLAAKAELILDDAHGDGQYAEAAALIQEALKLDPASGHAMVEQGRLILKSGYSNGVSPEELFTRAANLDPPYGRAYVLLGHIYTNEQRWRDASIALNNANRLAPNDPWLKLNWGTFYAQSMGDKARQVKLAEEAVASGITNRNALAAAYEMLVQGNVAQHDRERADYYYERSIEIQPRNAWLRGNYAQAVILNFADFEQGERLAREALAIMDYGHARSNLSLALYGKWARAVRDGLPVDQREPLYMAAYRNDPGAKSIMECAARYKEVQFVFEAIATKGVQPRDMRRC